MIVAAVVLASPAGHDRDICRCSQRYVGGGERKEAVSEGYKT